MTEATTFDELTTEMIVRGGMPAPSLQRFHDLASRRLASYKEHTGVNRNSGYLRITSVDVIAVGKK